MIYSVPLLKNAQKTFEGKRDIYESFLAIPLNYLGLRYETATFYQIKSEISQFICRLIAEQVIYATELPAIAIDMYQDIPQRSITIRIDNKSYDKWIQEVLCYDPDACNAVNFIMGL